MPSTVRAVGVTGNICMLALAGARGGAAGCRTAVQSGSSRLRFPDGFI